VTSDLVRVASGRGVATLTLDSPHNRNALSRPLLTRLRDALAAAAADPAVRVIVLDHTGPAFCAGADLTEPEPAMELLADLLADVVECPKPVLAKVGGAARAGGIGLVAACDIAVCAASATFAFTEVRLGVVPAVLSATVLPLLAPRAAARLFLTGERFGGAEAAAAGLVTVAVPDGELDATVRSLCDALLGGAPAALAGTKRLLRGDNPRPRLAELAALSLAYFRSDDAREGIAAFRERRDPRWVVEAPQ
jgi:methylglutaconyl-CoA hydratase